ncbi:MAG: hypothetical protein ACJ72N_09140 [Labedaea sp.]
MTSLDSPALPRTPEELGELLRKIQLLGNDTDRAKLTDENVKKWDGDTPVSLQVIKSGTVELTKQWTKWARTIGGGAAALSVVAGAIGGFVRGLEVPGPVVCALIATGGALAVAIVVSIAVIVSADLRARAIATVARTEGRAGVTAAFLGSRLPVADAFAGTAPKSADNGATDAAESALLLAIASPWTVWVNTKEHPGSSAAIIGVNGTTRGLRFITANDVLSIDEIAAWSTRS